MSTTYAASHQEDLITLLCHSDAHGKVVAGLVSPELFDGDYKLIAERAIEYWKQYGEAPKAHLGNLLSDIIDNIHDAKKAQAFRRMMVDMHVLATRINTDYVLKSVEEFTHGQQLHDAIIRAAEKAGRGGGSNAEVEEILAAALRTRQTTFDPALELGDVEHLFQYLQARETDEFLTGIADLDRHHVVPTRATLSVFLAATSAGKSWWLLHLGQQAVRMQKRVLHVTLELSAEEIQTRYFQNLLAAARYDRDIVGWYPRLVRDADQRVTGVRREPSEAPFSMQEAQPREQAVRRLVEHLSLDDLKIKKFPARSLSVGQLRAYLDALESTGFAADLLLVDYAGLMQTDADNYRISLGRVYEELFGLAHARNIAVCTAQQVNREGAKAARVDMTHISEDWSIAGTADMVLAFTRSEEEQRHKLGWLWANKNRSGRMNYGLMLAQNYEHGQFALDSCGMERAAYLALLEQLGGENNSRRRTAGWYG